MTKRLMVVLAVGLMGLVACSPFPGKCPMLDKSDGPSDRALVACYR